MDRPFFNFFSPFFPSCFWPSRSRAEKKNVLGRPFIFSSLRLCSSRRPLASHPLESKTRWVPRLRYALFGALAEKAEINENSFQFSRHSMVVRPLLLVRSRPYTYQPSGGSLGRQECVIEKVVRCDRPKAGRRASLPASLRDLRKCFVCPCRAFGPGFHGDPFAMAYAVTPPGPRRTPTQRSHISGPTFVLHRSVFVPSASGRRGRTLLARAYQCPPR